MPVSIFDLPKDDQDVLPAGLWHIALADNLSESFGWMTFELGITTFPIDGRALIRACAFFSVDGALRVEGGDACELGDCSRLRPAAAPDASAEPAPEAADPVVVPVLDPALAAPEAPADVVDSEAPHVGPVSTPTTLAELEALSKAELEALAKELDVFDGRWAPQRLQRAVAAELGIEV